MGNHFFSNDNFTKSYEMNHQPYIKDVKETLGHDDKLFEQELNVTINQLISTKKSLNQNDKTSEEELNEAINELTLIKNSQRLKKDRYRDLKEISQINLLSSERKYIYKMNATKGKNYINTKMSRIGKLVNQKEIECEDLFREQWNDKTNKDEDIKDDDVKNMSIISKIISKQSLTSHEEYFESCKIVGLDLVKANQDKYTENEKLDNSSAKANLNAEGTRNIHALYPTKKYDRSSVVEEELVEIEFKNTQIMHKLSIGISQNGKKTKTLRDRNRTERDGFLVTGSDGSEIDSTPSLISINSSFNSSFISSVSEDDTLYEQKKEQRRNRLKEEQLTQVIKFKMVTRAKVPLPPPKGKGIYIINTTNGNTTATPVKKGILGKLPSHVYSLEKKTWCRLKNKINKTMSNSFSSFLSSLQLLPLTHKSYTNDIKHNSIEKKKNLCSLGFQITVIVIFFFAALHFMHQDRVTSHSSGLSCQKPSPLHLRRENNHHSKNKELNNHDVLSISGMKDVSTETETDTSLYSFNEIFLLA